jgi:hypothetical protein
MKKRTIALILLIVGIFGSGSIVIVWMRMDISKVAKRCGELEDEREIVSREVQELRGQRSRALRPSTLASMVMGRLAMPDSSKTFHVSRENLLDSLGDDKGSRNQSRFAVRGEYAGSR